MIFKLMRGPLLLCLISIVSSTCFYLFQLYSWSLGQQSSTRFFQQSFEAAISQYEYLPALLARNDNVRLALTGNANTQLELNRQFNFTAHRSGVDEVYLMDTAGQVIATSNFNENGSFMHQNYSFRPYFSSAVKKKSRQFYYAIGATTGVPGFFISEPVITNDEQVIGVIVVKLDLRAWEENWRAAGQDILVASEKNVIILSGRQAWRYKSIGALSQPVQSSIQEQQQFGNVEIASLFQKNYAFAHYGNLSLSFWMIDGEAYLVNSSPIKDTGWNLYYLEENNRFVKSALMFFIITFSALTLVYLYNRERQSKLRSRRQTAENELRHRRELEKIIEKIHIGVISINPAGEILFLNEAARKLLQIESLTTDSFPVYLHKVLDVSKIDRFENCLLQSGDIIPPFHETNTLHHNRERQSKLRSRRQTAENELRHRRELEKIIEKIHIGVISINPAGEILFLNEAARKLLQIESLTTDSFPVYLHKVLDVSKIDRFENCLLQSGDIIPPFHETNTLHHNRKSTPVMFAISQVDMEGERRLLVTLVNIEKRIIAEQAMQKLNESLEEQVESRTQALRDAQAVLVQQSKAAALGQMAATVVHELSQPLSAMNSSIAATQLKVKKDDWAGAIQSISRLTPLSEKMNKVIQLLKSFSYADDDNIQIHDLALVITQSINLYQDKLKEKNVIINLNNLQPGVLVKLNPLKLDLVLINIIQNAIDAMEKCDAPDISIAMICLNNEALITIEDRGDGIDSRVMGRLFDPYFTTKDIGKGLGLGLSICHEIIREYNGSIVAENMRRGARFTITLPQYKNESADAENSDFRDSRETMRAGAAP